MKSMDFDFHMILFFSLLHIMMKELTVCFSGDNYSNMCKIKKKQAQLQELLI